MCFLLLIDDQMHCIEAFWKKECRSSADADVELIEDWVCSMDSFELIVECCLYFGWLKMYFAIAFVHSLYDFILFGKSNRKKMLPFFRVFNKYQKTKIMSLNHSRNI